MKALLIALAAVAGCASTPRAIDLQDNPAPIAELSAVFTDAGLYTHILDDVSLVLANDDHAEANVVIFLEDDGASLQALLTCPWRNAPGDPAQVATWNATRRFGRAYLDDEHHPVLAADLALDDTTTPHTVAEWGRLILVLADAFAAEVWPER